MTAVAVTRVEVLVEKCKGAHVQGKSASAPLVVTCCAQGPPLPLPDLTGDIGWTSTGPSLGSWTLERKWDSSGRRAPGHLLAGYVLHL